MRKGLFVLTAVSSIALAGAANAATLTYGALTVTGPNATSASCTPFAAMSTPVAANTALCQISVLPAGWTGIVGNPTGGADSDKFTVVSVAGVPTLENTVALTNTGSAAGTGVYDIGTSQVTP